MPKTHRPIVANQKQLVVSERFSAEDSDLTIQSNDDILFYVHKINLKMGAGGFAAPELDTQGSEPVCFSENAEILELLFQFCYPKRHPDLETVKFEVLAQLAEAAERYEIYAAMSVCKIYMKLTLPLHASDILVYAIEHNYQDIMKLAAPRVVLENRLSDTLAILPNHMILPWARYYEKIQQPCYECIPRIKKLAEANNAPSILDYIPKSLDFPKWFFKSEGWKEGWMD